MCTHPIYIQKRNKLGNLRAYRCRCGKCPQCKKQDRQEWSFRMLQELRCHKSGVFVTLTYNDANLPVNSDGIGTLNYLDIQKWLKRLRFTLSSIGSDSHLRYWVCGEYGKKRARPHYHLILYGLKPSEFYLINKSWGKGFVYLGYNLSPKCINYVSKYVQKQGAIKYNSQLIGSDDWCTRNNVTIPFRHMSLGLGKNYLSEQAINYHLGISSQKLKDSLPVILNSKLCYLNPILYVTTLSNDKGKVFYQPLPRYYRRKIFFENSKFDFLDTTSNQIRDFLYEKSIRYYCDPNYRVDVDSVPLRTDLIDSTKSLLSIDKSERNQAFIVTDLVKTMLQTEDYCDLSQDELSFLDNPHHQQIFW